MLALYFTQSLGIVVAALSLFALFKQFLDVGLAAPIRLMLDYYQQLLHALLGWADGPLNNFVAVIRSVTQLPLKLDPNWKHVFVLLWLYFSSDAKTNWATRKGFAIFSVLLGGFIALIASVTLIDLEAHALARASVPILGIFVWEVIRNFVSSTLSISTPSVDTRDKTWRQTFRIRFVSYALPIFVVGAVVEVGTWLAFQAGWLWFVRDFSTFALTAFVFVMALYWIARGIIRKRSASSGTAYLGRLMLSALGGAMLFLLVNAGLQKFGL